MNFFKAETYIHHKYDKLTEKDINYYSEYFLKICNKFPLPTTSINDDNNEQSLSEIGDIEVKTRAFCDIYFLLNNTSPLTTLHRGVNEEDFFEDDVEDNEKPNISSFNELHSNNLRIDTLFNLYPLLKISFLKAKVAYILGQHAALAMENLQMAEKLFFECVYILDILKPQISGEAAIVSELGTNSLLRYSEVLLSNSKYTYAIKGFKSAIENYIKRKRTGYISLIRRLATITKDNDDNELSISYFHQVLNSYAKEGNKKNNEVVFIILILIFFFYKDSICL